MTEELVFEKFPKLGRLKRNCTITEKIDGTNAQLLFDAIGNMLVGSRKRQIWPNGTEGKPKGCDNMGFAGWAYNNQTSLFEFLGEGRHYGEWCGLGIQRKYNMNTKAFALFNTSRFGPGRQEIPEELKNIGLTAVPVLYEGTFATNTIDTVMEALKDLGSKFSPGFMNPEGIVVYHHGTRGYFKVTYEHDMTGKGKRNQSPS